MPVLNMSRMVKCLVVLSGLAFLPMAVATMTSCLGVCLGSPVDTDLTISVYAVDGDGNSVCPDSVTATAFNYVDAGNSDDCPDGTFQSTVNSGCVEEGYDLTGTCGSCSDGDIDNPGRCIIEDADWEYAPVEYEVTVTLGEETQTVIMGVGGGFECGMDFDDGMVNVVFE